MKKLDRKIFVSTMENLCKYYKTDFNEFIDMVYWGVLQDLSTDEFKAAIVKIFQERIYPSMPQPGEIRQHAIGKLDHKAMIAAGNFKKAIESYGSYYTMVFDDPVIHVIVDKHFGSWKKVCQMTTEELTAFLKFDFSKLYAAYANRQNMDIKLELKGSHDNMNEGKSYYVPGIYTRMIGDEKKCVEWTKAYQQKVLENPMSTTIIELQRKATVYLGEAI